MAFFDASPASFADDENERHKKKMNVTLCFIKHTMPHLSAIDFEPLLKMWYEDGHNDANSLRRGDEPSVVVQRLAREKKRRNHTPIGTI